LRSVDSRISGGSSELNAIDRILEESVGRFLVDSLTRFGCFDKFLRSAL
jgi:hypothetical protein